MNWIRENKWRLGIVFICFGWWIITDRHKGLDIYSGYVIEKNGKKYSMVYVKGENE